MLQVFIPEKHVVFLLCIQGNNLDYNHNRIRKEMMMKHIFLIIIFCVSVMMIGCNTTESQSDSMISDTVHAASENNTGKQAVSANPDFQKNLAKTVDSSVLYGTEWYRMDKNHVTTTLSIAEDGTFRYEWIYDEINHIIVEGFIDGEYFITTKQTNNNNDSGVTSYALIKQIGNKSLILDKDSEISNYPEICGAYIKK